MQQRSFGPTQRNVGVIGQDIDYDDWDAVVAALRRGILSTVNPVRDTQSTVPDNFSDSVVGACLVLERVW